MSHSDFGNRGTFNNLIYNALYPLIFINDGSSVVMEVVEEKLKSVRMTAALFERGNG